MIDRPDQFEQNIEVLETMYKILASQSEKNKSSHPDWRVVFCGGPMGQIEETQAETNEYLRIPYPLPFGDVPIDLDPIVLKKAGRFPSCSSAILLHLSRNGCDSRRIETIPTQAVPYTNRIHGPAIGRSAGSPERLPRMGSNQAARESDGRAVRRAAVGTAGMNYTVKEIYYTLQGEGAQSGPGRGVLRFAGCNLWSGREEDRATAVCQFCDTDFVGTDGPAAASLRRLQELADAVAQTWPAQDRQAVRRLHRRRTALADRRAARRRTSSARLRDRHRNQRHAAAAAGHRLDHASAPRRTPNLVLESGDELKLVFPQAGRRAGTLRSARISRISSCSRWTGPSAKRNTQLAVSYCLEHPQWRLSLQTHKFIGIA